MGAAIGWGALAASSLVIGALIGLVRSWPRPLVGLVLGFGAGALISAVSFELFGQGVRLAGALPVAIGLGVGAMTYFVAAGLLAAIFVSNLPEAIGGATDMRRQMHGPRQVTLNWLWIAAFCAAATVVGYAVADITSGELQAGINGFAAGALIVMLVDSMIPEATEQAGRTTGLVTTLGFAVAAGLSLA